MKSKYIENGKVTLYTECFGNEKNPTCLLISGAGASARFWTNRFCQSLVSGGYFIIRYDHRDTGLSSAVDYEIEPYTIFDLAQDAYTILESYNIAKAHVVGHSMGGLIAQIMAVNYPNHIITFTSISAGMTDKYKPSEQTMKTLLENSPEGSFESDLPGFMRSWSILNGKVLLDEELASNYTKDLYERSHHRVGVAWNHINCQQNLDNLNEKLKASELKGLFIHGQSDPLINYLAGEENSSLLKLGRFELIPRMGHMFFNIQIEDRIITTLLSHFQNSLN